MVSDGFTTGTRLRCTATRPSPSITRISAKSDVGERRRARSAASECESDRAPAARNASIAGCHSLTCCAHTVALDRYETSGTDDSAAVHVQEDLVEMPGNRQNRPPLVGVPVQIHKADQMQRLAH